MKKWLPLFIAIVIVVGGGAFFGGMQVGKGKAPSPEVAMNVIRNLSPQQQAQLLQQGGTGTNGTGRTGGTGGFLGRGNGAGGAVAGDILSQTDNSITVKLSDGSTKIVLYSASTTVGISETGTAADLVVGKTVTVTGTANSDGSVTANRIQIGTLNFGPGTRSTNDGSTTPTGSTTGATSG